MKTLFLITSEGTQRHVRVRMPQEVESFALAYLTYCGIPATDEAVAALFQRMIDETFSSNGGCDDPDCCCDPGGGQLPHGEDGMRG